MVVAGVSCVPSLTYGVLFGSIDEVTDPEVRHDIGPDRLSPSDGHSGQDGHTGVSWYSFRD